MDSEENAAADASEARATPANDAAATPASSGKKRGRPPKAKSAQRSDQSTNVVDDTSETPVLPKKRGRKSLAELAREAVSGSESDEEYSEKKSKKHKNKSAPTSGSGKRRGRPPKNKSKDAESTPEVKKVSSGKRGRPPKKRPLEPSAEQGTMDEVALNNGTLKENNSSSEKSDYSEASKVNQSKGTNDAGQVLTEKRHRGRPRKSDKSDPRKWNEVNSPQTGRYTVPLPVPDSWPLVCNRDEIMKELAEMYTNVKDEKLGEFHNQIKAFVFALHWVSIDN
ncbi:hypothetical protein OSTOST_11518, partial [Ostertagia ostertagi]